MGIIAIKIFFRFSNKINIIKNSSHFKKAFNQALFSNNTSTTNRNDGILYAIFTYLIVFRFHELPKEEFRNLVIVRKDQKIIKF